MSPSHNIIIIDHLLAREVLTVPAIELTRSRDDWSIGWSIDWRVIVVIESLWIYEDWSTIHWIASMLNCVLLLIIIKNYKIILSTLIGIASWTFSMFNLLYNQGTLKWHYGAFKLVGGDYCCRRLIHTELLLTPTPTCSTWRWEMVGPQPTRAYSMPTFHTILIKHS